MTYIVDNHVSLLHVLYCKGAGQVCKADTGDDSWCGVGTQEVSMAEVSICVDDNNWCGIVHVQAVKSSSVV